LNKQISKRVSILTLIGLMVFASIFSYSSKKAEAALLSASSVQMSDSRPSATNVTYIGKFTFPGTTAIKCIDVIFGSTAANITTSPNPATTAPTSMSTTSGAKVSVTGGGLTDANWTLYNATNGILQYEYATGQATTATQITITTSGVTNTSSGTFYAQVVTYSSLTTNTCSTVVDTSNVMALTTVSGVTASVSVDPTVSFSVANYGSAVNGSGDTTPVTTTSSTIPFGTVAAGSNSWGSQTLTTSTNGASGYTLYIRDTQSLTNPNTDTIRNQAGTVGAPAAFDGSASQSSFGFTTDSTTVALGSNQWAGLTATNTSIHTRTTAQNADAIHVEYKAQISNTQPPGTYSSVVIYTVPPAY
jgi:hypothetical protein